MMPEAMKSGPMTSRAEWVDLDSLERTTKAIERTVARLVE